MMRMLANANRMNMRPLIFFRFYYFDHEITWIFMQ